MNIGADVYIEMNYKDALLLIENKEGVIQRKIQIINEQIIKNKTYIKLTLTLIEQIKNT